MEKREYEPLMTPVGQEEETKANNTSMWRRGAYTASLTDLKEYIAFAPPGFQLAHGRRLLRRQEMELGSLWSIGKGSLWRGLPYPTSRTDLQNSLLGLFGLP